MEENTPHLYELKEATRDNGLVGEESNVLTNYLGTTNGKLMLGIGPAASGKDETIWGAMYLIDDPEKIQDGDSDWAHWWSNSSSSKAPFYKSKELNKKPIHIIPDQVAVDDDMEGMVKAFGEGRDYTHEKVDVTLADTGGGEADQMVGMTIDCPRATMMCMADDNEKFSLRELAEMNSRAYKWTPDSSEGQTRDINQRQVAMRDGSYVRRVDDDRLKAIRDHYPDLNKKVKLFVESPAGEILNLVMDGIQEQEPIPPKFTAARRDVPKLMDFIDAVSLFHYKDRMVLEDEYPQKLLVTPADAWYGFRIFGEQLVMSALNLRPLDRKLLTYMKARPGQKFSVMDLQAKMQEPEYGENRSRPEIRESMDNMIYRNYIQHHEGSPVEYSASVFGTEIDVAEQAKLDWSLVVERAKEKAHENLSEQHAAEYINRYCEGDGLIVVDPIASEYTELNILEDTTFADDLEAAEEEFNQDFNDTDLWSADDAEADTGEAVVADGGDEEETLL